ncbi:unnamed protein product [Heligmosomoides polygyrus]|uniref:Reverse transcriptase domain-containing protein n=1 Tax=Heligmosomoides polygyrus TaxID=6339 RepID=A0A183G607_HELPZ|nr:unnamed protein product [Heligmosomoides polygyrus]
MGADSPSTAMLFRWLSRFAKGDFSLGDAARSGRPQSAVVQRSFSRLFKPIRRIREIVKLSDNQCGFVPGCGTIDAIHAARLLVEKHREKEKPVHTWLWTDDVKAKVREKNSLCHVFLGDKTAINWQKYHEAKKAAKNAVAVAKATHYNDVYEKLESRDAWRDYFEGISTEEFPHPAVLSVALFTVPFTRSPWRKQKEALKKMKPGMATGPDDLAAGVWKSKLWYPAV